MKFETLNYYMNKAMICAVLKSEKSYASRLIPKVMDFSDLPVAEVNIMERFLLYQF
jgi:uncharacterized protein YcgL (UPF0745 family)